MRIVPCLIRLLCLTCALQCCVQPATAQLVWRVSVKIILGPNGTLPATGSQTPAEYVQAQVDDANDFYRPFSRGYEFRVTETLNVTNHPEIFNLDPGDATANAAISSGIQSDPNGFHNSANAINVYLVNVADPNSASAFNDVIALGPGVTRHALAHEFGHYLGLCHTQGCGCRQCDDCPSLVTDGVGDTLPDRTCWTPNDIATNHYHSNYTILPPGQRTAVNNTYSNLMSYHPTRSALTSGQMDLITDTSNASRRSVVSGETRFVDRDNTCTQRTGSSDCTNNTGGPYQTVVGGVNAVAAGDIVLLRPGNYNETLTITKAITLRATRGNAQIGTP